jgi:hypothetical protein
LGNDTQYTDTQQTSYICGQPNDT